MRKFDLSSLGHSSEAKNPHRALDFARNTWLNSDGCGQEMATQVYTKLKSHISTDKRLKLDCADLWFLDGLKIESDGVCSGMAVVGKIVSA